MGCKSIAGLPTALNSAVLIYTPGWREPLRELLVLLKNTTQSPQPGLEPGPLDEETSALAIHRASTKYILNKILENDQFLKRFLHFSLNGFSSLTFLSESPGITRGFDSLANN